MTAVAERLDARGMNRPLPILRTRKALNQLASVEVLEVTATDPGALKNMASFCTRWGKLRLSSNETAHCIVSLIEKA